MIRVLFVCMGNICRSPMAEGIFRDLVAKAGLTSTIEVDSAGTIRYHAGEPAHTGTRQILQQHNINYQGRARQVTSADLAEFDYLLAMDAENLQYLQSLDRRGMYQTKIYRLLNFAPNTQLHDVPDPYYTHNFEAVYQLIYAGCQGLLNHIIAEHGLAAA